MQRRSLVSFLSLFLPFTVWAAEPASSGEWRYLLLGTIFLIGVVVLLFVRQRHASLSSLPRVKISSAVSLGLREKIVVIEWHDHHYLLAVTQHQVHLLDKREGRLMPMQEKAPMPTILPTAALAKNLLAFLRNR